MTKTMYAIYDKKANAYLSPFFMQHDGLAIRGVMGAIKQSQSEMALFPEDYALYNLGEFDDVAGTVKCEKDHPRLIAPVTEIKAAMEK